jgi:hypothetical protein
VSPRLRIDLDREEYRLGDTVKGKVVALSGGNSRSLEVWLDYREKTKDYNEVGATVEHPTLNDGPIVEGASFDFELTLPLDGYPNYKSEHGELWWELNVKSDEPGRDTRERRRIEVGAARAGSGGSLGSRGPVTGRGF